jgi:hypothetical protein
MVGVNVDGSAEKMSLIDQLRFGTTRARLEYKVDKARNRAKEIEKALLSIPDVTQTDRSVALLQYFSIEQFTPYKRYVLKQHYFPYQSFAPEQINPWLWIAAWLFIYGIIIFFLYWIFSWGVTSGHSAFQSWGINFILVFIQEGIFTQLAQIYILYFVAMYSIEPQLLFIYRALTSIASQLVADQFESDFYLLGDPNNPLSELDSPRGISRTNALRSVGAIAIPREIEIYPSTFENKTLIKEYLDAYNEPLIMAPMNPPASTSCLGSLKNA